MISIRFLCRIVPRLDSLRGYPRKPGAEDLPDAGHLLRAAPGRERALDADDSEGQKHFTESVRFPGWQSRFGSTS